MGLMVDFADDDLDEAFPLGDGTADTEGIVMCPTAASRTKSASMPVAAIIKSIEGCQVCCRPWRLTVVYGDDGNAKIAAAPSTIKSSS
jgi:hypothetical protein